MKRRKETGQALAEASIFALLAVLLGFALLSLIPIHRARTAATAAAYACTQFVSQAADAETAVRQAEAVGRRTIESRWTGLRNAAFKLRAWHGGRAGTESGCEVVFTIPVLFNGLLGLRRPDAGRISFTALTETWKASWK